MSSFGSAFLRQLAVRVNDRCLFMFRIPRIQGAQECILTAEADLTATTHRQAWSRPPIQVDFSGTPNLLAVPPDKLVLIE